ncbi:MAG TPA: response regulator [Spirochaetota bacterium]|nr:response regulator [Spirochaetota bacterium]
MYNILVVDFSPDRETIARIFREAGYAVIACESAFDAMAKLKSNDFDLIVSEVELPGDNAFDLYNYINTYYPFIPAIMITEKDIDTFFEHIFREGIGNVLRKPLREKELVSLARKLITRKNIFGLDNYMDAPAEGIRKIRINASDQIRPAITALLQQFEEWSVKVKNKSVLNLILNELIINSVYHSHGHTKEKEERLPVKLKKGEFVDLFFSQNEQGYGISITDYKGNLTKQKILESIRRAVEESQMILRAFETGEEISDKVSETGRGIDLVRKLTTEYYFVIRNKVRTEIILLFDREPPAGYETHSSLKIIEDPN